MIDPQGQANKWIKTLEMDNSLNIIRLTSPNLITVLEHAITSGQPVFNKEIPKHITNKIHFNKYFIATGIIRKY